MRHSTRRLSGHSDVQENCHTTPEPEPKVQSANDDGATSETKKRPSKKRKLDNSPPWKSATTQTPTSFIGEDGRRKSGRRNAVPIELLPPELQKEAAARASRSSERQRRLSDQKSPGSGASSTPTATRQRVNGRIRHPSPSPRSGSRMAKPAPARRTFAAKTTPSKQSSHTYALAPSSPSRSRASVGSKTTPVKPSSTYRAAKHSPAIGTRKSARTAIKARHAFEEELERLREEHAELLADYDGGDESSELSSLHSDLDSDLEISVANSVAAPQIPRVKLKLKVSAPKPIITHPSHIPPDKEFDSLEELLNHDDPKYDPAALEAAEEEAREEAGIRNRLLEAVRTGSLTVEMCSSNLPEKQPEPERQYGHQDHLVAHALVFQKLLKRERREHVELMKKRNAAVMAEIRARRPRTKEEIEEEQYIENQRSFKEQVAQLRRKWEEVTKEVEKRRIERAKEEKRLAGKEHLKQMLEHSTQLLEARRGDRQASLASISDVEMEDDEVDYEENDEGEEQFADNDGAENMSSDGDEDEAMLDDDDENLTVEQLRAKYGSIYADPSKSNAIFDNGNESEADDEDADDDEAETEEARQGEAEMIDSPSHNNDEEPLSDVDLVDVRHGADDAAEEVATSSGDGVAAAAAAVEDGDDGLVDDSDESIDMDSEDSDDGEDEDEDESEDDHYGGLASLYGTSDLLAQKADQDNSDEDFQPDTPASEAKPKVGGLNPSDGRLDSVAQESAEADTPAASEGVSKAAAKAQIKAQPASLENGETLSNPVQHAPMYNGNVGSPDMESASPVSHDAKDSGQPPSSPTTSPETTPQPSVVLKTPVPFLLRGTLREYQHYGLDWLAGLYSNNTNGILADEMGLGKTIQTIALLAHLACEKEVWGPHLIVVPTSVMLNWEMEFKKWAPGFKILTYYGSREQRLEKRKGWFDNNLWHICITSYQLVLQDANTFKRRDWHYLVLDEAHNIKNFRSQRWQTLLNFKTHSRLLLTGTPLQNNLVELWSLLYFLMPAGSSTAMPAGFTNLEEFQQWFSHPVDKIMEGGREAFDDEARNTITKLHKVLRPYLLRRLKSEVEKQMPGKYEHVVYCRLSKRQRYLYDDFMSMAKTRETLASGNYLSIINCLMQLRKVCNHPDLFETRQIVTSFAMPKSVVADYEIKELLVRRRLFKEDPMEPFFGKDVLESAGLVPAKNNYLSTEHANEITRLSATRFLQRHYSEMAARIVPVEQDFSTLEGNEKFMKYQSELSNLEKLQSCIRLNHTRTQYRPLIGSNLAEICTDGISRGPLKPYPRRRREIMDWFMGHSRRISELIPTLEERAESMETTIHKFGFVTPAVVATDMPQIALSSKGTELVRKIRDQCPSDPYHAARMRLSIAFPDKRLLQYDCGKLQRLDILLRELQADGHRALIFTQMTKVLDILEQFLNIHGHRYLRLDGATKIEQRQILTDRFNNDPRIPVFILSTRSGGLGINLTGADTVIFYDLDWNPAMDKQCQDRCHRIGQTRDVHIYRFVSEYTIESNILRKSDQKRMLDDVVIQEGEFTTDYFNKLTIRDMLGDEVVDDLHVQGDDAPIAPSGNVEALEAAEDVEDVAAAKVAQKEVVDTDVADFAEAGRGTPATPKDADASVATTTSAATPKDGAMEVVEDHTNRGLGHDVYGTGYERVEREPEHVDEYMIRFMEWELKDVPVVIPMKSRDKRKKNKKGKPF